MSTEDVFAGLPGYDSEQQKRYEQEARDRWGDDAIDASKQRSAGLSRDQASQVMADHAAIAGELAALLGEGITVDDPRTQGVVARHHAWVSTFWVPDAEAYLGLGQMYVEDDRFRATYDAFGEGTAAYLRDAIEVYASTVLRPSP